MRVCSTCYDLGGCYRNKNGLISSCECEQCFKKASSKRIKEIRKQEKFMHQGFMHKRTKNSIREKIFYEAWMNENRTFARRRSINFGMTTLESVTRISNNKKRDIYELTVLTDRDYKIAATVIQWLGTNCGQSFLDEVQREIKKQTKELKS